MDPAKTGASESARALARASPDYLGLFAFAEIACWGLMVLRQIAFVEIYLIEVGFNLRH